MKASQFLKTICLIFLCTLNVKTAELFECYTENVAMHIVHILFKKQWFNVPVPVNCLNEKVVSEKYIYISDGWFHHKRKLLQILEEWN